MKTFTITLISLFFPLLIFAQDVTESSIKNIRRNSIYLEIVGTNYVWSVNYDRLIPISNTLGSVLRLGVSDTGVCGELNVLIGKSKHFLEIGVGYTRSLISENEENENYYSPKIPIRIGYRYQASKGFTIRAAPMLVYDTEAIDEQIDAWFGLSLGYSF